MDANEQGVSGEARWGALFPGTFVPVLTLRVKCSLFRLSDRFGDTYENLTSLGTRKGRSDQSQFARERGESQDFIPSQSRMQAASIKPFHEPLFRAKTVHAQFR